MTSKDIQKIEKALNENILPNQKRFLKGKIMIQQCRRNKLRMAIIRNLLEMESILVVKGTKAHTISADLKSKLDKAGIRTANIVLCLPEKKNNL